MVLVATLSGCDTLDVMRAGGSREAFEVLWPRVYPLALRRARRMLRSDTDAEFAAQETMTRLWRRWPELHDHPNHEGWVHTTCVHVCLEMGRRRRLRDLLSVDRVVVHDTSCLDRPQLVAAVTKLTKRQRDVVMARYYFDLSVAETAALLDRTEQQVRTAAEEGLRRLRSILDPTELLDA